MTPEVVTPSREQDAQHTGDESARDIDDAAIGAPPGAPIQAVQPLGDPFPTGIPLDWLGEAADNLRFSVDVAGRAQYNSRSRQWSTAQFYGFDLYKVFSGDRGDLATLILQGFATRIDNVQPPPFFFDSSTDWQFVYRIFSLNVKVDPRGAFNVKVGHYEMPFGLEALLDTNGTLRQVGTMRNLGVKADWGATLNGVTQGLEYEVGLGRGSGNEWHADGSPFQFAGRVGTIRDADSWVGVSGFVGDLWRPGGVQVRRRRIGIDGGVHHGPWSVMGEVSGGTNDGNAAINGLAELDWHAPDDEWLLYGQLQAWTERDGGWNRNVLAVLGLEWALDRHIVLSVQFMQDLAVSGAGPAFVDRAISNEVQVLMRVLTSILAVLVFGAPAFGQAYCAMRDPVTGIFKAFPQATSYRSITQTVTPDHRAAIAAELPFTLHFNELGRHTVYLAFKIARRWAWSTSAVNAAATGLSRSAGCWGSMSECSTSTSNAAAMPGPMRPSTRWQLGSAGRRSMISNALLQGGNHRGGAHGASQRAQDALGHVDRLAGCLAAVPGMDGGQGQS